MRIILHIAVSLLLVSVTARLQAQQPDTSGTDVQLKPLSIEDSLKRVPLARLPDVGAAALYAGRKTEVLRVGELNANLALQNPRELFGRIPGANIWENDGTGIQLAVATRGLNPNRLWEFNVRMNGYDISSDPFGYPEAYFTPPAEAVQEIQLVRGAASLQYGPQLGGLINFVMHEAPTDKPLGGQVRLTAGSYGLLSGYGQLGGTTTNQLVSYQAMGVYRQADTWRPNSAYDLGYGYGQVTLRPTRRLTAALELSYLTTSQQQPGGLTDAQLVENPDTSVRARNWFGLKWIMPALTVSYELAPDTRLTWITHGLLGDRNSTGFTSAITTPDNLGNRTVLRDEYRNVGSELRLVHSYPLAGAHHALSTGVKYFRGQTLRRQGLGPDGDGEDYTFLNPDNLESFDYTLTVTNVAVYAENAFQVAPRLKVVPGLRAEYLFNEAAGYYQSSGSQVPDNRELSRTFLLLGLASSYQLSPAHELYASFSQSYRPVTFNDTRVSMPTQRVDPDLADADGYTLNAGLRGVLANVLTYDVSGFWLRYNDRIGQINTTEEGSAVTLTTNLADARNRGIESFMELNVARALGLEARGVVLGVFNSTAYVDARYVGTDSVRSGSVNVSLEDNRLELAPAWVVRTGLTLGYKWVQATLQHAHTSRQYSDALNTEFTANASNGRIPTYNVWDLAVRYTGKHLDVVGGLNNLFNETYFTRRSGNLGLLPGEAQTGYVTVGYRF